LTYEWDPAGEVELNLLRREITCVALLVRTFHQAAAGSGSHVDLYITNTLPKMSAFQWWSINPLYTNKSPGIWTTLLLRLVPNLLGVGACSPHPLQLVHVTLTENGCVFEAHQLLHINGGAGVAAGADADGSVHPLQFVHVTLTENGCVFEAHQLLHINGGAGVAAGVDADGSVHPLQLVHVTLTENGCVFEAHQLLHINGGAGVGADADGSVHPLQLVHVTLTENGCVLAAHQLLHINGGAGVGAVQGVPGSAYV